MKLNQREGFIVVTEDELVTAFPLEPEVAQTKINNIKNKRS